MGGTLGLFWGMVEGAREAVHLFAGTPSGRLVSAHVLLAGFFALLVLSATRYRATKEKPDAFLTVAFFVATLFQSMALGVRLSVDLYALTTNASFWPYLPPWYHFGRGAYLFFLAAASVAQRGGPSALVRRLHRGVGAAVLGLCLLSFVSWYERARANPRLDYCREPAHLLFHGLFLLVGSGVLLWGLLGKNGRLGAFVLPWSVVLAGESVTLASFATGRDFGGEVPVADLAWMLHVPALLIAVYLVERQRLFEANRLVSVRLEGLVDCLTTLMDVNDPTIGGHSRRHADLAKQVGSRLGLSGQEQQEVYWAALLHDLGKMTLDRALLSAPRRLNGDEWRVMQRHPEQGARIVAQVAGMDRVAEMVAHHHERWDGTGYPKALKGEEILLGARIVAVIDAFDAMVSARSYRRPHTMFEATEEIRKESGAQFDPRVVDAFLGVIKEYRELPEVVG